MIINSYTRNVDSDMLGADISQCSYPTGDVPVGWSRTEHGRLKRAPSDGT